MPVDNFPKFSKLVAAQFQTIAAAKPFVVGVDGDALYATYCEAFPSGTNPILKKKPEHDCSCCKSFIRHVGNVVSVSSTGRVSTIWDIAADKAPHPYNLVAAALRAQVLAAPIADIFRVSKNEESFGAEKTRSLDAETQQVRSWNHFYTGAIPASLRVAMPDTDRGNYRTTVQVFERGLAELTPDAVDTVLSLIEQNALYRGAEHKPALLSFQKAQREYANLPAEARSSFAWSTASDTAARFRNTVIGTLVQDLSEGKDLEASVKSFETKVAPTNYKRTTALITPGMVKKAMETIESLGLEEALERRFARIEDVSVEDVLWVDSSVKPLMKGGIGDVLMAAAARTPAPEPTDVEDISIDAFVKEHLPQASSIEVMLKNEHLGNLMSITAPVHPEPKRLFRWTNDFAWSYSGNIADSIKERVKKAGGKVDGASLRVSLSWFNYDDLDLHIIQPPTRQVRGVIDNIFFGNREGWSGGKLDVDMNAGSGRSREPVENVVWTRSPPDGVYRVMVNNYNRRETADPGFVIEIEAGGKLSQFSYNKGVHGGATVEVARLFVERGQLIKVESVDPAITAAAASQDKWGLKTEQFVKVNAAMFSPNFWGSNEVGNKHFFLALDGACNDEPTRGIYNEFLDARLEQHRKVFEVIGDKTKCQPTDGQLSGLGFSSTKKDSFMLKVKYANNKRRILNVKVG